MIVISAAGCDVVFFDGGGFCDECVTELQEQCVQDDVRLAGYAAEFTRTAGAASAGEAREAYDVVAGPSSVRRDDVEQLMGHQGDAHVMKILDTNVATERELERVFRTQRESGAATCGP